ncbi:hypothetical protein CAEBREN_16585 [Caenorhabditis brenneri]|uniref:Proline dehydrogenase n=1 Tax=Caenorhabditis brenneri TaxID=135651 RepID=G0P8Y7_CAEBE|nr:hypothetical protein CAEBREN_16585 [Caenorhabditis brenneri]
MTRVLTTSASRCYSSNVKKYECTSAEHKKELDECYNQLDLSFENTKKAFKVSTTYFYEGEEQCDKNRDIFKDSINAVASATGNEGFVAVKVTALGRPQLLLKLSEAIVQTQNFFKALTGGMTLQEGRLTAQEFTKRLIATTEMYESCLTRIADEVDRRGRTNVSVMVASHNEDTVRFAVNLMKERCIAPSERVMCMAQLYGMCDQVSFSLGQAGFSVYKYLPYGPVEEVLPYLSRRALENGSVYNKTRGNVFNTYQAYLKQTLQNMEADMQVARREGWHFGAKLVRGAYMEQERARAQAIGYEDPVNPDFQATTKMYESCLTRIADEVDRRGRTNVSVMVASHNEDTVRFAVNLMKERCIAPSERVMCMAQLYGMCDQVSFSLGQAGFSVYKYLPYGPVEEVLPYLSRRALENGSVLKKANKERDLLWKELKRRISSGEFKAKTHS